jgi:hypothetical protein
MADCVPISVDYFTDSCYQALAYWTMSAMTNDPFTLARYAGYYKAIQSAVSIKCPDITFTVQLIFLSGCSRELWYGRRENAIPERNCQSHAFYTVRMLYILT